MEHDNTLIKQAIDNYSHFSPNQKEVLNILIDMAVDGQVVANINDICAISTSTRATVSTAISFLNKYELIINCDQSNIVTNRYFSKKIIKKYLLLSKSIEIDLKSELNYNVLNNNVNRKLIIVSIYCFMLVVLMVIKK